MRGRTCVMWRTPSPHTHSNKCTGQLYRVSVHPSTHGSTSLCVCSAETFVNNPNRHKKCWPHKFVIVTKCFGLSGYELVRASKIGVATYMLATPLCIPASCTCRSKFAAVAGEDDRRSMYLDLSDRCPMLARAGRLTTDCSQAGWPCRSSAF